MHDVANRVLPGQVGTIVGENAIEHADQARHLAAENFDPVGIALALGTPQTFGQSPQIRSQPSRLKEGVLDRRHASLRIRGQQTAVLFRQVQQDGARLPDHEAVVVDHGDLVIRREGQKIGSRVVIGADLDPRHFVVEAEFFEGDGSLAPVGRGRGVKSDHRKFS